jgi:hypothetical protein
MGDHVLQVRAVDAAGNADPSPATWRWTVDQLAPDTTIVTGPPVLSASTTATFTFTSNQSGASFECELDNVSFVACPASYSITGMAEGNHRLRVRAVDPAGNRDFTPAVYTWTVDTIAPDALIVSGPAAVHWLPWAVFHLGSRDGTGADYECNLDQAGFTPCADPYRAANADGPHVLSVRVRDAVGNVDLTPATWTWTVAAANIVFATRLSVTGAMDGLAGADARCASAAASAGLGGIFRAYLSTSTVDAIARLGSARGWVRVDGQPVADTTADLAAGRILHPIELDASGGSLGGAPVLTGSTTAGRRDAAIGTCADWTSNGAELATEAGSSSGTTGRWMDMYYLVCSAYAQLYCFETDRHTAIAPPPASGRLAFLSMMLWTPGGGLASADAVCVAEAAVAGLAGSFKAALATPTAGAMARFSATGPRWVRVDGVPLTATTAAMFDPATQTLETSLNVTASGQYVSAEEGYHWAGPRVTPGVATCQGWTSAAALDRGGAGIVAESRLDRVFVDDSLGCSVASRLLCLQE